jgi:hypothetical protein
VRAASRGHGGGGIACGAWTRGGLQRDGRLGMPSSVTGARQSAGLGQRLDRDSTASLVRCLVVARVALHSGRWPVTGLVDCLWMCAVRRADGLMHHNQPPETPRSPGGRTLPARTSTRRTRAGQRAQAMRRASWGRDTAITHSRACAVASQHRQPRFPHPDARQLEGALCSGTLLRLFAASRRPTPATASAWPAGCPHRAFTLRTQPGCPPLRERPSQAQARGAPGRAWIKQCYTSILASPST